MSLKDVLMKYYDKENNYSCSESMIRACNDYYHLNLSEDYLKAASAFSRGMYGGFACGALAMADSVLGLLYTNGKAHESKKMQEIIMGFNHKVKLEMGNGLCGEFRSKYYSPELRCSVTIGMIADLFEEYMKEIDKQ